MTSGHRSGPAGASPAIDACSLSLAAKQVVG